MNKISLNPDNLKNVAGILQLRLARFLRSAIDKVENPKRVGLYLATAVLGLSASRFASSIIVYSLSTQLHGMVNPANTLLVGAETRKVAAAANVDLASIIDGVFFKRPVVEQQATQTAAPSQNFTLIGTLEGDPAYARAVIRIAGVQDEPREYALGEKIGNAVLIVIGYEKIWVRENGAKYKIEVGESSQEAQSKAATPVDTGAGTTRIITRQEINDKILGNPAAIYGGGAAFGPNLENGQITGFKLHRIPEGHIFYSLGARSGDIIKSVNGYPLSNTGQMMELWNNIKTMPRVSVDLLRDGKPMRYDFEIRN